MTNAANSEEVARRAIEEKQRRLQELEDIRQVASSPAGVRLFKRLLARGKLFETTFTGNSQGMFLEGHRNFALMLLHDICEAKPDIVSELMRVEKQATEDKKNGGRDERSDTD